VSRWRALAWRGYERLPRSADGLLRLATRTLLPVVHRQVPLTLLRGRMHDGSLGSVLVAGTPPYLPPRVFAAEPGRDEIGTVPVWRLRSELARRRADVDLVIARVDAVSAALAVDASYVRVPEWVGAIAPVPADPWAYCRARKSFLHNVTRVRRAGYTADVSHAPADFEAFYAGMYAPFIRRRYGGEGVVSDRPRLRRCFNQGGIVWALRDGVRAAGALYRTRGRTLDLVVVGTANGELAPLTDGAAFALDLFVFEHARRLGCSVVDFGGSRPSPRDGLLLYKARWNADVVVGRTTFYDLALFWRRLTPALVASFARTPLVIRQADGLAALAGTNGDPRRELGAMHAVLARLRRLYLVAPASDACDLGHGAMPIPVVRIDPAARVDWRPPWRHDRPAAAPAAIP
jgi:hypothetical protein